MNVFYNTIVFVKDLNKSKWFYETIIGLKIIQEYDSIIFFENHFVIHDLEKMYKTVFENEIPLPDLSNQSKILIYFETDNLDNSFQNILLNNVQIIHPIKKQIWNQRVFRFYDPDKNIVEIGEAMHLKNLKSK